jgi:hypothetical protein
MSEKMEPVAFMHPLGAIWRADNCPSHLCPPEDGWIFLYTAEQVKELTERLEKAEAALAEARKVIDPLKARADKWVNNTDSARVSVRLGHLRALSAWLQANKGDA